MTEQFFQFQTQFLGANTWEQRKDGIPLYLLDQLSPEDLLLAEDALINAAQTKDTWPIIALGYIHSQKASSKLYALIPQAQGITKITLAHALFLIKKDPLMAEIVVAEIEKINNWSQLIEVITMLPDFKDARLLAILESLKKHPDFLVSYHAKRASAI
ncbi:MAG: hypothetical protein ACKOWL_00130 [Sphingobacteriaceae bacterium]